MRNRDFTNFLTAAPALSALPTNVQAMSVPLPEFTRWELLANTSLSAVLPGSSTRCGIYILEFANGEQYGGQSIHVVSRYAQHCRTWNDITAVSFAELPAESLNGAERALLSRLESQGIALRNKALIGHVTAPAILDTVVSRDIQDHWAMGATNVDLDTERIALATERDMDPDRSDPQFQRGETLLHRPDGEGIFADLLAYVGRVLPDPSRTDGRFWTASALPKTRRGGQRALLTLSCGDIETLVMLEDEEGAYVFMNAHRNLIDEGAWTVGANLSLGPITLTATSQFPAPRTSRSSGLATLTNCSTPYRDWRPQRGPWRYR